MFRSFRSRHYLSKRCASPESGRLLPRIGYAYLMALFMMVATIIASQVAMKNILTEGRREREADMIWRGQQFVRAIRLYYLKTGHYPSSLDDLKKGMPELHFLRYAAYKRSDEEGRWRMALHLRQCSRPDHRQRQVCDSSADGHHGYERRQDSCAAKRRSVQSARNSGFEPRESEQRNCREFVESTAAKRAHRSERGAEWGECAPWGASGQFGEFRRGPQNPANSPQTPAPAAQATASAQTNQGPLGSSASPASPLGGAAAPRRLERQPEQCFDGCSRRAQADWSCGWPRAWRFSLPALAAPWISLRSGSTTAARNIRIGSSSGIPLRTRRKRFSKEYRILRGLCPASPDRPSATAPAGRAFSAIPQPVRIPTRLIPARPIL